MTYGSGYYSGVGPTAWSAPETMDWSDISPYDGPSLYDGSDDCVVKNELMKGSGNPSPSFNPYVGGIASYLSNIWVAMSEASKQQEGIPRPTEVTPAFEFTVKPPGGGNFINPPSKLPPSYTYDGPIAGAGFLGLFPPAPGSPEYNAYVNRNNSKVDTKPPLTSKRTSASPLKQLNTWGGNVSDSYSTFTKSVSEGYNEEKGHEWYDLIPGFADKSNLPMMLAVGGGILLLILIIK